MSRNSLSESMTVSYASITGRRRVSKASPAEVGTTLRVVRLRRRTPSCSSRFRIVWLSVDAEMPSCFAARVKLRCSATTMKALNSPKCFPCMPAS